MVCPPPSNLFGVLQYQSCPQYLISDQFSSVKQNILTEYSTGPNTPTTPSKREIRKEPECEDGQGATGSEGYE
jgi:hypothetical protein